MDVPGCPFFKIRRGLDNVLQFCFFGAHLSYS
jgi:hypothetical protein